MIRQMALSQSEAVNARMLCRDDLQPHGVWLTSSNDPCLKQGELSLSLVYIHIRLVPINRGLLCIVDTGGIRYPP